MDERPAQRENSKLERQRAAGEHKRTPVTSHDDFADMSAFQIDRSKRHIDKSTVADFWRQLEGWIQSNKPWLSF